MDSMIRLFRAVPITKHIKGKVSKESLHRTVKSGFVLSKEVLSCYKEKELEKIISTCEKLIGLSGKQANSSFHKSWKKVRDADIESLVLEQIVHYITTYGFESLGIYDESTVFIPAEALQIPDLKIDKLSLILIKGYTKDEIKEKLLGLLNSGIAIKDETVKDALDIATWIPLTPAECESIRNKEVRIALFDYLGIVPENPTELLRYIVFKATNKTLLIKDEGTLAQIKGRNNVDILGIIDRYSSSYGLHRLAEIFYRFKPIFLSLRTSKRLRSTINKIRKLAVKHHKPMPEDYLNSMTAKLKCGVEIKSSELGTALDKANFFRKVRLAYALSYRTHNAKSIVYKIRNGKSFATDFSFNKQKESERLLKKVLQSISLDLAEKVNGKRIYIPPYVSYSLPATEKQFTGIFPSGTAIHVPKDIIIGVYWENVNGNRIDLDLSLLSVGVKYGWDAYYRSNNKDILFSGDMVDAHNGASELFYVSRNQPGNYMVFLNYYNFDENLSVPFKLFVAKEAVSNICKNYAVNPNNILATAPCTADRKEKALGLLSIDDAGTKFLFSESNMGKSITSSGADWVEHAREYMITCYKNPITLADVLTGAGARIVDSPVNADINLSPSLLEKDTIINLLGR